MRIFNMLKLIYNLKIRQLSNYSWHIILLGGILLVAIWFRCWLQINYDYDRTIGETSRETMNLGIAFEDHVRRILADADKDLLNQKKAYEKEGISSPIIVASLEDTGKDPARFVSSIASDQGILIASFNKSALATDVSDRDYFQFHRDSSTESMYIGKPIKLRTTGMSVIPVSRRINHPDGSFAGVIYIYLKSDYFSSYYNKMDLGQDQRITLLGMDWIVRARQSGDNMEVGQNVYGAPLWRNVQAGRIYGTYISTDILDGISRIVSYRVMPDYPVVVSVGKATQVALAPFEKRKQSDIVVTLLASIFILAFCHLLVRRAEQQLALNKELSRIDRLNVVGEIAAGIAHEIRNPMTTVRGYLQMFQRKEKFSEYQEQLQLMIDELDRGNSIVTEFLALEKNKDVEMIKGNLNDVIQAVFPLIQPDTFRRGHDIQAITMDIPDIWLDQKEIKQLILNLTRNALEAMTAKGKITIKTYCDNNTVTLAIQDTGPGIPEEIRAKLGTPFVTTKESGTGLGLPICYRIAQRHTAVIDISTSKQGTTFFVIFPTGEVP